AAGGPRRPSRLAARAPTRHPSGRAAAGRRERPDRRGQGRVLPQITLTAVGGYQSTALSSLFTGPAGMWTVAGGLTEPIFDAGRIRSTVRLAEAQQQEAVLVYQQTIQQAFREVSDALVAYRK